MMSSKTNDKPVGRRIAIAAASIAVVAFVILGLLVPQYIDERYPNGIDANYKYCPKKEGVHGIAPCSSPNHEKIQTIISILSKLSIALAIVSLVILIRLINKKKR